MQKIICGLPIFDTHRKGRSSCNRKQVQHLESVAPSLHNGDDEVSQSPQAEQLVPVYPLHSKHTHTRAHNKLLPYIHSIPCSCDAHEIPHSPMNCPTADPPYSQLHEYMTFMSRQLQFLDEHDPCERQGDLFSSLLNGSFSPVAKYCDDAHKLAWLKSQLIGENEDFLAPFGVRRLVYADHAASGRSLFFIEDLIAHHLLPVYGNTHTDDSYVGRSTSVMMKQAEGYIKAKLGGSKDDVLLTCGWGSTAAIKRLQEVMGITVPSNLRAQVLTSIQACCKKERWLVFTGPYEHHSNLLSWRQSLAEVIEIPADKKGEIDMVKMEAALQDAKESGRQNMIGAFSACSNVTGVLSETRAIARLLHKYGAFACFDFAAGAPHLQVEMRSSQDDGYDAIMLSPHKLLGGPGTPGLLLMRKVLYQLGKHPPSTCGGGTVAYVNGFNEKDTLYYESIEEREEGGTPAIVGKVRCALAFWLKEAMGQAMIEHRETLHLNKAMTRLSCHPNIQILGGCPSSARAPIFSFLIYPPYGRPVQQLHPQSDFLNLGSRKPLPGRFVVTLLNDLFGIQARGGCSCAGPYGHLLLCVSDTLSLAIRHVIQQGYEGLKPGWARVSLCYSMTEEEVEYIISAIELLADFGHRFLALYDFDWHSGSWTYSAHGEAASSNNKVGGHHHTCSGVMIPKSPGNNRMWGGEGQQFRQFLLFAEALAHLLPKCSQPKPIPEGIDPDLLLFCV